MNSDRKVSLPILVNFHYSAFETKKYKQFHSGKKCDVHPQTYFMRLPEQGFWFISCLEPENCETKTIHLHCKFWSVRPLS